MCRTIRVTPSRSCTFMTMATMEIHIVNIKGMESRTRTDMDTDMLFNPGWADSYDCRLYKFIACFLSFPFPYSPQA